MKRKSAAQKAEQRKTTMTTKLGHYNPYFMHMVPGFHTAAARRERSARHTVAQQLKSATRTLNTDRYLDEDIDIFATTDLVNPTSALHFHFC